MSFEMYQDNILDHYENPSHRGTLEHPTFEIRDLNPLCGDEVHIQALLNDAGCLTTVCFEGKGCVISLAAASMLSDTTFPCCASLITFQSTMIGLLTK